MRSAGETVARYTIVSLLGRGGMGEVYEAEDTVLKRRVALKLLPAGGDEEARQRMLREARTAARFDHPNAVTIFDAGISDDGATAYIAMELVRGSSLRAHVGDSTISREKKLRWIVDCARGLAAAHRAGLVHRDVKPDNLMVRADGRLKILDFGVAKQAGMAAVDASAPTEAPTSSAPLTQDGVFVGTPRYAAPEQLRGEAVDGRSDQYAWATTAFELLTGSPPFEAESGVTLLSKILASPPPRLREKDPTFPADVDDTLARALSKGSAERFPSMDDAADRIEPFADRPISTDSATTSIKEKSPPATAVVRTARSAARVFFVVAAAFGTLIIVGLVVAAIAGKLHLSLAQSSRAEAPGASDPAPTKILVRGLTCEDAKIEGGGGESAELAHALGIGACARLAIEAGLPWAHEKAKPAQLDTTGYAKVSVAVKIAAPVTVTIRAGDLSAEASGSSPLDAVQSAATALAPKLDRPPLTDADRLAWGATTDESARRIERVWRQLVLGFLADPEGAVRDLVTKEGDSPWSHVIMCLVAPRGSAASVAACKETIARLARVTPSRAKALEGVALLLGQSEKQSDAIRLFRQAYRDAPDDPDVAGLYGAIVLDASSEEAFGIIDGVAQRFPTYAMVALTNAVTASSVRDATRNATYIKRLDEIVPEKACADYQLVELFYDEKLDDLQRRYELCTALFGRDAASFPEPLIASAIAMARLDAEGARSHAKRALSDNREELRSEAIRMTIASNVLGGRFEEGIAGLEAEITRQRDQESPRYAIQSGMELVRLLKWLGRPIPRELIERIRAILAEDKAAPDAVRLRVEAQLVMTERHEKKELEAMAKRLVDSKNQSDAFYAIALLREVYGDVKAREILDGQRRAATRSRVSTALEYALLLESLKADEKDIESALRLAMTPVSFDGASSFVKVAARIRLAALYERTGRKAEAERLRAEVDRAWKNADRGGREAVEARLEKTR